MNIIVRKPEKETAQITSSNDYNVENEPYPRSKKKLKEVGLKMGEGLVIIYARLLQLFKTDRKTNN